jgi:hypothetical protein
MPSGPAKPRRFANITIKTTPPTHLTRRPDFRRSPMYKKFYRLQNKRLATIGKTRKSKPSANLKSRGHSYEI